MDSLHLPLYPPGKLGIQTCPLSNELLNPSESRELLRTSARARRARASASSVPWSRGAGLVAPSRVAVEVSGPQTSMWET